MKGPRFDPWRAHQRLIPTPRGGASRAGYTRIMQRNAFILFGVALVAIAVGVAVFISGGSDSFSSTSLADSQQSAVIVPFITLAEGPQSKIVSRGSYLIDTQEELAELWKLIEEPPPVPTVDFSTKVVVAVFAGEVPTAGYDIAVAEVEDADKRMVKIELTRPDEGCVLAQSMTAPYQVIELPKTSLLFTHADTWVIKSCE